MELTPAIVLRKSPWSETSLILTWLTERFGTLRAVARGARRAGSSFAGQLDLFHQAEISVQLSRRGDLHTLREASGLQPFDVGRAGSAGFYLAAYFGELSGLTAAPMHPAPEIFDLLRRGLDHLQNTPASERALLHFERELGRILGIHDAEGRLSPHRALSQLCGKLPRSRDLAIAFLSAQKPLAAKDDAGI